MDLKYILSLTPDDLNDDEKDELYTFITWFDSDTEEIDQNKFKRIFKISQEILKYKGEQVETLLHELEELALKQGEEEAKKQEEEIEMRSTRSRKSSSIEYENLEQKYMELKTKYKKIVRANERNEGEIEKLNKKVTSVQQENRRLQNELQSMPHEVGSESDVSETIKDQQRELVQTIHNKNKQISDLLTDIEEVENENQVMREKLSKVRDELADATKEITSVTDAINEKDNILKEQIEVTTKLTEEIQNLKKEMDNLQNSKVKLEKEFESFKTKTQDKVAELESKSKEKDEEISGLKSKLKEPSVNSSISSLPKDEPETSHINVLKKILAERENRLLEVQRQLQVATKEMEESTIIIKKLTTEKQQGQKRLGELEEMSKELKKQLKTAHERCQNLQEEITFAEKDANAKDEELKMILSKIKESGDTEFVMNIEEMQTLKSNNRFQEKQIMSLVKASNKLQDACEYLEKENLILREKLGIPEDEEIQLSGYSSKEKKRRKEMETLKKKLKKIEEINIELKSDIHKLNQTNATLTNQLLDLGQKPIQKQSQSLNITDESLKQENKNLVEENEALRKGLHEILNSVNTKKAVSLSEIKSETFEKLLRTLDARHVSGWYHPAMRLQAELHNLEGINAELRDQLKYAREELKQYKSEVELSLLISEHSEGQISKVDDLKQSEEVTNDGIVEDISINENIEEGNVEEIVAKLFAKTKEKTVTEEMSQKSFNTKIITIQQNVFLLIKNIIKQRSALEQEIHNKEEQLNELNDNLEVLAQKNKVLDTDSEEAKLKGLDELAKENVKLKRQAIYRENETKKLSEKAEKLYKDLNSAESSYLKNVGELQKRIKVLESNLMILKNLNDVSVDGDTYKQIEKGLNNIVVKYRELAQQMQKQEDEQSTEKKMLKESQNTLENDKAELKYKLSEALKKIHIQNVEVTQDVEKLAQKLSETELKEITERQRANHTNNLYELVREQLSKSEERFSEYSKYNEELLKKNLILQEQLKEAEDKIMNFVDRDMYKQVQFENNRLISENGKLETIVSNLNESITLERKNFDSKKTWNDQKEQELLNLKHQIVDLISISDEKVIISQLNNDMSQCRQSLTYYRNKYKDTLDELSSIKEKLKHCEESFEGEMVKVNNRDSVLNAKIKNLQNLMTIQKIQYLGCIPLYSEEMFVNTLRTINEEKHQAFLCLHKTKILENETSILKEQLETELDFIKKQKDVITEVNKDEVKNILNWLQEKKTLQINELRFKRQSEFKERQLKHFTERIAIQDEQILKLEEELLSWQKNFDGSYGLKDIQIHDIQLQQSVKSKSKPSSPVTKPHFNTIGVQTEQVIELRSDVTPESSSSKQDLNNLKQELANKNKNIDQLKNKMLELETSINTFKTQLGDKQSQISFYERHIIDLQNKKEEIHNTNNGAGGDNINVGIETIGINNEELIVLRASVKSYQDTLKAREEEIMKYQTLLKVDRDKHSLAAATLQDEIKNIQRQLTEEKEKKLRLEESFSQTKPNRAAIEQYVNQVHALEQHTSELHTKITTLEAQLQSSRQEAVRWRGLANDRLSAMEDLRKSLEEQHKNELMMFKTDSQKLRELNKDEINTLKQLLDKQGYSFSGRIENDIQKLVVIKDEKINELSSKLRQIKTAETRKNEAEFSPKISGLESSVETLAKENEVLKNRCEQFLIKERTAKDEIRDLKSQLLKRPMTARSDKSDRSIKDQLQRKITTLENQIDSLKRSLLEQISINETHKVQASEDFEKWKKMKQWQQTAEKLKNKLKERDNEHEKLQQTSVGYRLLIERLEREKHNLENRIKNLKTTNISVSNFNSKDMEMLHIENMKLQAELETMSSKLEMQQHHSGSLGAALMQEKLESQERKIAILELAAKGTTEVRAELERLQISVANLQKSNLRLEAENLDLKLDLEKSNKEVPHLQQQIQHLENYVEILKTENCKQEVQMTESKVPQSNVESKKVSELERTVFILKRVVEKLQAENKRLLNGRKPISDRVTSADKTRRENIRLKEQYGEAVKKIGDLEQLLANNKVKNISILKKPEEDRIISMTEELSSVKEQLEQKSSLLDKVKVLLHRAATKEKSLLEEIDELKNQKEFGISPIPEESEGSSSDL